MVKTTVQPPAATAEEETQRPNDSNDQVKYKGVRLRKWGKYVSEIRLPNSRERIWLGSFRTAEMAARAFDAALFCLRGAGAKFNFPDDPPSFAGAQALSPAEIRATARSYASGFGAAGSSSAGEGQPLRQEGEQETESPTSNSEEDGSRIDWTFLDDQELDLGNNSSRVFENEFEQMFSPDIGDDHMCMPWQFGDGGNDDDDQGDNGNGGNVGLWSFW